MGMLEPGPEWNSGSCADNHLADGSVHVLGCSVHSKLMSPVARYYPIPQLMQDAYLNI